MAYKGWADNLDLQAGALDGCFNCGVLVGVVGEDISFNDVSKTGELLAVAAQVTQALLCMVKGREMVDFIDGAMAGLWAIGCRSGRIKKPRRRAGLDIVAIKQAIDSPLNNIFLAPFKPAARWPSPPHSPR